MRAIAIVIPGRREGETFRSQRCSDHEPAIACSALRRALHSLIPCLVLLAACDPGQDTKSSTGKAASDGAKSGPSDGKAPESADAGQAEDAPAKDLIREAPGVDLSRLAPDKREVFFEAINTEASACDKPHSLAVSLRDDGECRVSIHDAQFIADRVAAGAQPGDIKLDLDGVIAALKPREIDVTDRPFYGNERAPVTLVVFADFQCPVCKAEEPKLRAAVDAHKGRVKLVFKQFPLAMHARGEAAAIAAEAAYQQDQFWEMADKLFGDQQHAEDEDFLRYASELGLDVDQFQADMASEEIKAAVAKDRAEGETLDLPGTPTVFVNGREVVPQLWGGDYGKWIEDALRR